MMWLAIFITMLATLSVCVYMLMYMFLMGSSPGKNAALDAFIKSSLGDGGMLKTVLTFGYVKATVRRCVATYRAWLTMSIAKEGGLALDALVVDLQGQEKSLLKDFVAPVPHGMPLILNMGSYT